MLVISMVCLYIFREKTRTVCKKDMEKQAEGQLSFLMQDIRKDYIFHTTTNNVILKNTFKHTSKKNTNLAGYPDRIYYDKEIQKIVVIECKSPSVGLEAAVNDSKWYLEHMNGKEIFVGGIFCCGFTGCDEYKIYEYNNGLFTECDCSLLSLFTTKKYIMGNIDMTSYIKDIHNYIRNHTKISNEDKPLVIASILIALKEKTFAIVLETDETKILAGLIIGFLKKYEINTERFEFLITSLDNKHIYFLAKKIKTILDKDPTTDILNVFYTEFVKYQNSDSKSLGIVLTPHHIVHAMVKMLEISRDDVVLDLCSGTGSFLCESIQYQPKQLIGVEYQEKLFNLLQINIILRHFNDKSILFHDDCFLHEYQATKSIINPPFGSKTNGQKELNFIIKQLRSVVDGGLVCAIVPVGCFSDNPQNNILKNEILKMGKIKSIILCRKDLFQLGNAAVRTCIINIQRSGDGYVESDMTRQLDYRDDGMENYIRTGFRENSSYQSKLDMLLENVKNAPGKVHLAYDTNWVDYGYEVDTHINKYELELEILTQVYNNEYQRITKKILENNDNDIVRYAFEKTFTIGELFSIVKKPTIANTSIQNERVPLICASKLNLGIKEYITSNAETFDGNKLVVVTGGDGGAGMCHYHPNPFNITSSTKVLIPKINFLTPENGKFVAMILSKHKSKYSYSYQWNNKRIINDTIVLPVDENGNINFKGIIPSS